METLFKASPIQTTGKLCLRQLVITGLGSNFGHLADTTCTCRAVKASSIISLANIGCPNPLRELCEREMSNKTGKKFMCRQAANTIPIQKILFSGTVHLYRLHLRKTFFQVAE